jgi:glycosyltransferase involved in cell wall biosynthesis
MPYVSVIIPTYNRSNFITETIDSVLAQTYLDFEIIIVDDGSTDNTLEVLSLYGEKIKIIQQDNQGQGPARNAGIKSSKGEWIAFLDSDDLWKPNKLQMQYELIKNKHDLVWVYSDADAFDVITGEILYSFGDKQKLWEGDILEKILIQNFIPSPTPLIKKSIFEHVGYFHNYEVSQDWDMWMRISEHYPIGLIPMSLALYRKHPGNITSNIIWEKKYTSGINIINDCVSRNQDRLEKIRDIALANLHYQLGFLLIRGGDLSNARQLFNQAIKMNNKTITYYFYYLFSYIPLPLFKIVVYIRKKILKFYGKKVFMNKNCYEGYTK